MWILATHGKRIEVHREGVESRDKIVNTWQRTMAKTSYQALQDVSPLAGWAFIN